MSSPPFDCERPRPLFGFIAGQSAVKFQDGRPLAQGFCPHVRRIAAPVPRDFSPPAERLVQFQGRIASGAVRVRFDHNAPPVLEDGRGQAAPLSADGLAAILATAERPRTDGRGVESHTTAQRRGRTDAVIAGLLFMGGLRRSEVSALEWRDVADASDGDGVLLTVRTSKTNQEGDAADVRYLKNGAAKAIRTVRADRPDAAPTDRVVGLSPLQIQRRFTAAARAAGIEARLTAHSGRVGLASELTARGASTTEVMLAGNWRTSRMVAHYSAGATAERGAVKKYL